MKISSTLVKCDFCGKLEKPVVSSLDKAHNLCVGCVVILWNTLIGAAPSRSEPFKENEIITCDFCGRKYKASDEPFLPYFVQVKGEAYICSNCLIKVARELKSRNVLLGVGVLKIGY